MQNAKKKNSYHFFRCLGFISERKDTKQLRMTSPSFFPSLSPLQALYKLYSKATSSSPACVLLRCVVQWVGVAQLLALRTHKLTALPKFYGLSRTWIWFLFVSVFVPVSFFSPWFFDVARQILPRSPSLLLPSLTDWGRGSCDLCVLK